LIESSPFFSFIIPALNAEKILPVLLTSINDQTEKDYEIIVVDNGSTDNTQKIISNLKNVRYFYTPKRNRSHARNFGAIHALGKYLCFIDADVKLSDNWLKNTKDYILENPYLDFIATQVIPSGKGNSFLDSYRLLFSEWKSHGKFVSTQKSNGFFPVVNSAACIFLKDSFFLCNKFDESLDRNEDLELSIRCILMGFFIGTSTQSTSHVSYDFHEKESLRIILYLKRAFWVNYYALLRNNSPKINIPLLCYFFKLKNFKLIVFSLFVEVFSFTGLITGRLLFKPILLKHPIKKINKKSSLCTFINKNIFFILKKNIHFLFFDKQIILFYDFSFNNSKILSLEQSKIIIAILNSQLPQPEDVIHIQALNIFEEVLLN
jgi:glycosyltransferase involved in cell wall biosynthesis